MSTRSTDLRLFGFEIQTEGPTPARVWGDQWLRVSEKVLKGLNHQLANRVAGLEAVVSMIHEDGEADAEMIAALAQEVSRLGKLLTLYTCMPAEPFAGAEPVRLQDIIPQVMELHRHHSDLQNIDVMVEHDETVAPILVRPSALLRSLLVVLASGAGNAFRSGSSVPLLLTCSGDERDVLVAVESPQPPGQLLFTGEGSIVHAIRSALAHARAVCSASIVRRGDEERIRYELRLPNLTEARRQEILDGSGAA